MDINEIQLIKDARMGDNAARETLFRHHVEKAVRLAYLITRDWPSAEDAVQDAFIRAFKSMGTFHDGYPFAPWFTRIVVNQARKVKSKAAVNMPVSDLESMEWQGQSPEDSALRQEDKRILMDAIYGLGDKYSIPVILKYFSNFSEIEIAEVLKVPVSTVKSRLYTARLQVRKRLVDEGGI